ncbi:MAG: hypothetical protein GVY10_04840 [Verrucomicrobia bacterium]|jgi:sucrose phosphorylase|nr:hypothetical protein [Verrucomicrobiota bacterium]
MLSLPQRNRLLQRLRFLYGEEAERLLPRLDALIGRYGVDLCGREDTPSRYDERSSVLITYGDSICAEGERPLRTLRRFLHKQLRGTVSTVHLLPFFPYSSDDGFSVIDFRRVDPELGQWEDLSELGKEFSLMFDLVLNHCSRRSEWFQDFVTGIAPARWYFLPMDPATDLSAVVRPRSSPLLTKTSTRDGPAWVWTTFSEDQIDLNWQNPDVLFEFLDILFLYLARGCRIFRLDAVAYLWKELGTGCIHLPQTHEVVKLLRDLLFWTAPEAMLLTETNVPHEENLSYFGEGDEAHMVYNFSLPPLLLHALLRGDGTLLKDWLASLPQLPPGRTFFNFTASHDGIGVRPLQGLVSEKEIDWVLEQARLRGGRISMKADPGGGESPYELNITYRDALGDPGDPQRGLQRFLCSQAVALALPGVPGVYIHSLFGTRNDEEGLKATGRNRSINRRKWREADLIEWLRDAHGGARVYRTYLKILTVRREHRAFHPDGKMTLLETDASLLGFLRVSPDGGERILCLFNLAGKRKNLRAAKIRRLAGIGGEVGLADLLRGRVLNRGQRELRLEPFGFQWLQVTGG